MTLDRKGPQETSVRRAQETLDGLWAQTDVESRAYTGNIIALTEKKHLARVEAALDHLGGRHAGRQLIGVMDGDETVLVQASLIPQRGVFVERLVIDATPEQLQGAILPLLRPATVNHVWWASDDQPGGALLAELAEIADQVVGDTLTLNIPTDRRYALADLGWARSSGWREVTAGLFDAPEAAAQLPRVRELRVEYTGKDLPARLFAGWIASRLGWADTSRVHLQESPDCPREGGDLCGVLLEGEGVRFEITATDAVNLRLVSEWDGVHHEAELSLPPTSLAEGLGFVMSNPEQSENFVLALTFARRLG